MVLPKKIAGLDLLRFLMAVMMVIYHVQPLLFNSFYNILTYNGFYGTSTFLILSGFILTHVYQNKIKDQRFSNKEFLIKRWIALYPMHFITLLFSIFTFFLMFFITGKSFPIEILPTTLPNIESSESVFYLFPKDIYTYVIESVFLLQAWDYRFLFFNAASWSVSCLMFFYLFFYIFVRKINKINKIKTFFLFYWLFSLIPPLFFTYKNMYGSDIIGLVHRNPILRISDFIYGIFFYYILINLKNKINILFPLILSISGFIAIYFLVKNNPNKWFYLSHNGLFAISQISLIYCFINIKFKNENLINVLSLLGKSSLSIYMLHLPLLYVYIILYKIYLSIVFLKATSINQIVIYSKDIKYINEIGFYIFLVLLIPFAILVQKYFFTPLQTYLSTLILKKFYKSNFSNDYVDSLSINQNLKK